MSVARTWDMAPKALIRISLAAGVIAAIGGIGCSIAAEEDDNDANPDAVTAGGDVSQVLKSTLQIEGCTAAKVGPRHLLLAARCVNGKAAFATGKTLAFRAASSGKLGTDALTTGTTTTPTAAPGPAFCPALAKCCGMLKADGFLTDTCEAIVSAKDEVACQKAHVGYTQDSCLLSDIPSGTPAAPTAPTTPAKATSADSTVRTVTIASVKIHPSFVTTCTSDLCDFGKIASADAADIALIVLDKDLDGITTIPIDLDPVGEADPLLVVSSGCASVDVKPIAAQKTAAAIAVPVKNVNHTGSAYKGTGTTATKALAGSYVITPATGWKSNDPKLCPTDIGAPVFRATQAAITGVTSNYTTYAGKSVPVTVEHTRVDSASTLKIGQWLSSNGAETVHTCSDATGGCKSRKFAGTSPDGVDGTTSPAVDSGIDSSTSTPDVDGGADGSTGPTTPTTPTEPVNGNLTSGGDDNATTDPTTPSSSSDTDAGTTKKKKAAAPSGCSAAPGSTSRTSGGFLIGLGLALGAVVSRRRRRAA